MNQANSNITLISAALVSIADPGLAAGGAARWARSISYSLLASIQPRGFWTLIQYGALWVLPDKVLNLLGIPNAKELRLTVIWITNFSRYGVIREFDGDQKGKRYMNETEETRLRNGAYFCIEGDHMTGGNHIEEWLQMQIRYHEAIRHVSYGNPGLNDLNTNNTNAGFDMYIKLRIILSCILALGSVIICILLIIGKDYNDAAKFALSAAAWLTGSSCIMLLAGLQKYSWIKRKTLSPYSEAEHRRLNGETVKLDTGKEFYKLQWRTASGEINDVTKEVLHKKIWKLLLEHEVKPENNAVLLVLFITGAFGMIWFTYMSVTLNSTTDLYVAVIAITMNIIGSLGRGFAIAQDPIPEIERGIGHKRMEDKYDKRVYVKEDNNIFNVQCVTKKITQAKNRITQQIHKIV
jgi:hypothetical protein